MTEQDWLDATDPDSMLDFLGTKWKWNGRKHRLFEIACCRRVWPVLSEGGRNLVQALEGFVDGRITKNQLTEAIEKQDEFTDGGDVSQYSAADLAAITAEQSGSDGDQAYDNERKEQACLLRNITGNPFQPVKSKSSWLSSKVVELANQIYQTGAFDRLPRLAKALESAGCPSREILEHCRQLGPHVRGCWVLDLILKKK